MAKNVAEEAIDIVTGDREQTYGDCRVTARRIAGVWSGILGHTIHPYQVPLMMAGLKLVRGSLNPGYRDSLRDACGYMLNAETVNGEKAPCFASSPPKPSVPQHHEW